MKIWFDINKKEFELTKKKATSDSILSDPNNEDCKNKYLYQMEMKEDNVEFDDGRICLCGNAIFEGKEIGFLDISFKPDQELIVSIIETYVKQLNKVKTLIEATK